MTGIDLYVLRDLLGGEIGRDGQGQPVIRCPGPGHSREDRSLSVWLGDEHPDGFRVKSFAEDDDMVCRDHVRERAGLPPWRPTAKVNGHTKPGQTVVATYVYRDIDGQPVLRVRRLQPKSFRQDRPRRPGWLDAWA